MVKSVSFAKGFRFAVSLNGDAIGVARVSDIEKLVRPNGQIFCRPVEIENGILEGRKSLSEMVGNRPWEKTEVTLIELDQDYKLICFIHMKRCKFLSFKVHEHDASKDEVVMETIKVRPKAIDVFQASGKEKPMVELKKAVEESEKAGVTQ